MIIKPRRFIIMKNKAKQAYMHSINIFLLSFFSIFFNNSHDMHKKGVEKKNKAIIFRSC